LLEDHNQEIRELSVTVAKIDERTKGLVSTVDKIEDNLSKKYVTQDEFKPVKALMYGLVGVILTSVMGSIILLVLK